ncbi:hypothetical protein GMD78_19545 [Ornithinibacillus sp. L9]|uniref:DUF4871 domain-containing protein n=1 Tax=Ornithinibacillus caprae TaxID=2678566 RepID=A0A6N8FM43_9BACI|nr:hypothetical protein [Ornithinibacillus caprae]MUK90555.1 hypothetical protein [Ornithinibacillus caprae]
MMYRDRKFTILFAIVLFITGCATNTTKEEAEENATPKKDSPIDWQVRNDYLDDHGQILFSVLPDPNLTADKPYSYVFNFKESFDAYKNKELTIYAYHKEKEERITALSPKKISDPSPGYSSLEEFTTVIELPHSGLWRFEIVFDEEVYGDVIIEVDD